MGVHSFTKYIQTNFSSSLSKMKTGQKVASKGVVINHLMIDLNGMVHTATQTVYQYGNGKVPKRLIKTGAPEKKTSALQKDSFAETCRLLEEVVALAEPTTTLVICIDGPAPMAKQNQQRQRRFKSAQEASVEDFEKFNNSCISPGTQFMSRLSKYIEWFIRTKISTDTQWSKLKIIFSSDTVPGEGEQKCLLWAKRHKSPTDSFMIHGLDADLIMLGLGSWLPNYYVLREDLFDRRYAYYLIDIGGMRTKLIHNLDWNVTRKNQGLPTGKSFNKTTAVYDFLVLMCEIGCDFLSHTPGVEIITGGIDRMIDVYKQVGEQYGGLTRISTVEDNPTGHVGDVVLNMTAMEVFLGTLSYLDKGTFENKLREKHKFIFDPLLEGSATYSNGTWNLDEEKYHKAFYDKSFGVGADIKKICHEYIEGIQWVLTYYTGGRCPDWKWVFRHSHGPFAIDMARHISDYKQIPYKSTSPNTPFQQLLSVLPPRSAGLLPAPLSDILASPTGVLAPLCPEKVEIDSAGCRAEWQGIVLLPVVDTAIINEAYTLGIGKVDVHALKRDRVTTSYVYTKCNEGAEYKCRFGVIENCKVAVGTIDLVG